MNSLTDRDVIDKLSEALRRRASRSSSIIRGICCIMPGVPGKTDDHRACVSIVGRFLEHARIYAFGEYSRHASTWLERRHDDEKHRAPRRDRLSRARPRLAREIVRHFIELQLADNVKARQLTADGTWARVESSPDDPRVVSQEVLLREAYERARAAVEERAAAAKADRFEPEPEAAPALTPVEDAAPDEGPVERPAAEATPVAQPAPAPEPPAAPAPRPAPARRRGRVGRALSLFGQAFGTLFGGGDE